MRLLAGQDSKLGTDLTGHLKGRRIVHGYAILIIRYLFPLDKKPICLLQNGFLLWFDAIFTAMC